MTAPILGIDLGTTNSCAALADDTGNVRLIPYRGGEFTVPSIYAIDDKGNELVGYEAKRQWQLNPKRTVHGAKRVIGMRYASDVVQRMRAAVTYEIVAGPDGEALVVLDGKTYKIHEISGKILAKVRDVASANLNVKITRAVVTVPAYFNDRQRQAVYEAGNSIGLEVVRIINEPTAAALAYGARRNVNEMVAVYDLGGGTFDISVISIRDRIFEVKSTGGDVFLGGLDFDEAIIRYVLGDFRAKHDIDLSADPIAMQRLRDVSERIKIDLSSRSEVPLLIPFVTTNRSGKPLDINMVMRRDELETLTLPLMDQTFETCARVIEEAGTTPDKLDQVILVGGQTRMPAIQKRIADFFGRAPSKMVHPDESVAIGAALYAWSLESQSPLKLTLLDVLPMAIGIETAHGTLHKLFERNCAVPNRKAFVFTTHKNNQKDLVMRLYQGDKERARDNVLLGEFTFAGLRPGEAGSVRVEVVFDVSLEGTLSLNARDVATGQVMQQSVRFRE
ncbi:MAG: Hsp70 family protein [Myxococcota bacterium]